MIVAVGTISKKGLTTIPAAIRKALDLKEGDRVAWEITNHHVEIRKHVDKNGNE